VTTWLERLQQRIVQKYTTEALNVDRNALKKKCRFSVFTRHRWNVAAKCVKKFHGWSAQVLNSYQLKEVVLLKVNVFDRFPLSSLLRNQTRLSCSHSNVRIGQCTHNRDIPNHRLTTTTTTTTITTMTQSCVVCIVVTLVQQTDLSVTFMQLCVLILHLRFFVLKSWYYKQTVTIAQHKLNNTDYCYHCRCSNYQCSWISKECNRIITSHPWPARLFQICSNAQSNLLPHNVVQINIHNIICNCSLVDNNYKPHSKI